MPSSQTAFGPGTLLALVLAVSFSQSVSASFFCRKQVAAHAGNAETTSTMEGLHFLLVPYFSDVPHSFLLDGSAIRIAHSFLAGVPQSASELEAGGPKILVVNDSALDPVLNSFLMSCTEVAAAHYPHRGEKLAAALKKKLSAYQHGRAARRIYPNKFAQYQKLLERKVVRLGDLLETGFFTDESHLAFAVLSYLAFAQAGVGASVRLGTMTEHGADASAPALGKWFHHYAWMETQNHVASFAAGVRSIQYIGTEGAREVAVGSLFSRLYHSSRGVLDMYVSLPTPAAQITHQSYLPWSLSAPEHTLGTLRVQPLYAQQLEQYFEAFRR
jgi:hypothetical protein